jgi:hypothetical protein
MLMQDEFSRTRLLLGFEAVERLSRCRVAVFGVGGVGSYAAEALARSGVGALDLFDDDVVSLTNLNRQAVATVHTLGMSKVINSSFSVGADILNFSRYYSRGLPFIALLTLTAIVFNNLFIEAMGINGAAYATLCSYLLYFTLLHSYLWWRLKVNIFSRGQLKIVVIIAALLALDWAWNQWLTPAMNLNVILGAILKTAVLGSLAATAVILWNVSPTVNRLLLKFKKKL